MTRDGVSSRGKTEQEDRRKIEMAEQRTKLLLNTDGQVAETGSRGSSVWQIVVVVGSGKAQLCFGEKALANAGFGKIKHELTLRVRDEKAVFKLQAALGDDHARICNRGTIGRDDDFRIRNGLSV